MALQSPFANLYEAILTKLDTDVPELRYINQEMGQLEEPRPSVSWPCALLDIDEFEFTEVGNDPKQLGDGFIILRLGLQKWSSISSLAPALVRERGLANYELENKIISVLHNWAPNGFGRLLRRKVSSEKREDDIRVRVLAFAVNFEDSAAVPVRTITARPNPIINQELTTS